MRIAFLAVDPSGPGGSSRSVVTQANALAADPTADHEVSIISVLRTSDRFHHRLDPRVQVEHLVDAPNGEPRRLLVDVDLDPRARLAERPSLLVPRRWDPRFDGLTDVALEAVLPAVEADVLVTTNPALLAVAVQLAPSGVPLVHQQHHVPADRSGQRECLLSFAPRADALVAPGDLVEEWLRSRLGAICPVVHVIPHPLPVGHLPRSRLDRPLMVAAGRLSTEKGFARLVAAFADVADRIPAWRLRIVGEGPQRHELRRVVRKARLWDRVELPGIVTDMAGEWARASVAVVASRSDSAPIVVSEAMGAGVPVIGFDTGHAGARGLVEHEVNGLLVAPGSRADLSTALLRLATDEALRRRLGEGAHASSRDLLPELLAPRWEAVFEAAVAGHATSRLRLPRAGDPDQATDQTTDQATERTTGQTTDRPYPVPAPAGTTPRHARAAALALLAEAADRAGVQWFALPPRRGPSAADAAPTVVVAAAGRDSFLAELGAVGVPAYLSLVEPAGGGWPPRRGPVPRLLPELRRGRPARVSLEPWPATGQDPGPLSQGARVDVEFWVAEPDGDLVAPRPNPWATRVPAGTPTGRVELDGVELPTLALVAGPQVTECRFPVDAVYTWVDGSDPGWDAARAQRLAGATGTARTPEASGQARFSSRDELRQSLRSLHLFAPWIRRIHLVTAGQVPAWLDTTHPRVAVVDHTEILPAEALPTFNSQAIETGLHRIPGLSEHFVYFNDDMFLGRPVAPEAFFTAAGQPSVFLSPHSLGPSDLPGSPPWVKAAWNNRRLLQEAFGTVLTHSLAHAPYAHRRSLVEEVEQRFPDAVAATASSPFRSDTDVSMLSSLAQHVGLATGAAVAREPRGRAFVDLSSAHLKGNLAELLARQQDFVCIGEGHEAGLPPDAVDTLLADFLQAYCPEPAPWEKPA